MARTLVGILQILLKQDVTQKAPAINSALQSIERQAQRLGNARWGAGFQRQLDRLKLAPAESAAIAASYDRLARDINGKINRADLAAWRHGTLAHLAQVRAGLKDTAAQAKQMHAAMNGAKGMAGNVMKPALVALGAYTGWYAAGIAMREGFNSAGERQREVFRQDMAGIPDVEKDQIASEAQRLAIKYPSVPMTEIMEMARTARNTMGTTEAGLALLEDMVRGLVTLQSSEGVDAAGTAMMRLIRGLDNLGLNSGGEVGLASMKEVIAGAIRAAQIEGGEIDVGQYFDFARRAKVAGPALSDEFLATTSAAIMQDMTASGAGNALAMFFKSFVLGDNSINGKVYKERQADLGLREAPGSPLVNSQLAGENPYQWVKQYLVPALTAQGVDLTNDTAVAEAVGRLSGNTNATGLLTRLVTQSDQIERLISLYSNAMGPDAADRAREEDPFVSLKGLTSSLGNLSAAVGEHVMPVIVPALNALTDTINGIAASTRDAEGWQVGLSSLALMAAGFGAFKVGGALFGGFFALTTAGPSLQTAAIMLQGAATSLGGGAAAGAAGTATGAASGWMATAAAWVKGLAISAAPAVVADLAIGGPSSVEEYDAQVAQQGEIKAQMWDMINSAMGLFNPNSAVTDEPLVITAEIPGLADMMAPQAMANMGVQQPDGSAPAAAAPQTVAPDVDTTQVQQAGAVADTTKDKLAALNAVLKPVVDLSNLNAFIALLQQAIALQSRLGAIPTGGSPSIDTQMRASYTDFGISP